MTEFTLLQAEISSLKRAHRAAKKKRDADRIKAIILLGTGWAIIEVAEVLLLDDETIRNYIKSYKSGEFNALLDDNYKGYSGKLLKPEIEQLNSHLNETTYLRTQDIVSYVARHFKVAYSISGMTDLLHRLNYSYKKLKLVPGKTEAEVVYTICDKARYYISKKVKEYLGKSKIELVFLPPYSPNLNLIERLWKYFRKIVLYNEYYETFDEFRKACKSFFRQIKRYKEDLTSLLTENFQIINSNT